MAALRVAAGGKGLSGNQAKSILVIDDERLYCEAIADILQARGYATSLAHTGRDGMDSLERLRPDLVIADVMMPDMDGISLLRLARQRMDGRAPAWVVCSAKVSTSDRAAALSSGADAFLPKPFTMQELLHTINLVLGGRGLHAPTGPIVAA
jgi:DNA-binding response OmpR family regulator